MKKTEYEKIFLEIKKVVKDEYFNFYLVYRNIKNAYFNTFLKKDFQKVLQLCKKYNLNCIYVKNIYKKQIFYSCIISYQNIPKNIFKFKNKKFYSTIGLTIGYPLTCVKTFATKKNNCGHNISVQYKLKNSTKKYNDQVYYFMCNKPLKKHMKDFKKKVVNECKKNLPNIFSYLSIHYEISKYDFSKKHTITNNNTKIVSQGTTTFGKLSKK